ncbi:PREDICTED: nucleoside diphosphate-linked moiety X motif 13-like isoform X1 [Branchiostoma belcheri]|uniref:NAD(+) diphosphatase n=1 Tax=Branchiostoma belcheri TaxID=7741 RepID=A0A6P4ZMR7_BRABE|nr:PREDICTED: nucleoside diphosphate-linked moiety X motif 13-like isoform X1 [Branchiostoma belcheri]
MYSLTRHFPCFSRSFRALERLMTLPNNRRLCRETSTYVHNIRAVQKLKENDDLCKDALERAVFTVLYDLKPLLVKATGRRGLTIPWWETNELMHKLFQLRMDPEAILPQCILLNGCSEQPTARFAFNISSKKLAGTKDVSSDLQTQVEETFGASVFNIRKALFVVSPAEGQVMSQAHSLLSWHASHQFCSQCGGNTTKNLAGSKRRCSGCEAEHYPQMAPVGIVLVTHEDNCLLARQKQFAPGMYSALAGFCDIGESLEDTVRREVAEEVGLEVDSVSYMSSQHWPFPASSIMFGCYASVKSMEWNIDLDKNELEDAKWFSLPAVQVGLLAGPLGFNKSKDTSESVPLWLPPREAIAHQLIKNWVEFKINKRKFP